MCDIIPFQNLYEKEFNIKVLDSLKQDWKKCNTFSCINNPKTKNIFIYLNNCSAKYTLKDGRVFYAGDGELVFTPIGLEYKVEFFCNSPNSYTIGINVLFSRDNGDMFIPEGDILIVPSTDDNRRKALFSEINDLFMSAHIFTLKIKALFYELLSELLCGLRSEKQISGKFNTIRAGILLIERGNSSELKVSDIARLCFVSEAYFRRLFREYSGVSPIEYIINSKIDKAKKYLKYEDIGIGDIAELCGFESEAYFCRIFKKKTGFSPLKYRSRFNGIIEKPSLKA